MDKSMNQREEMLGRYAVTSEVDGNFENYFNEQQEKLKIEQAEQLELLRQERIKQEELWEGKEFIPLNYNLVIKPTDYNPYIRKISSSGLILNNGSFKNPDSGEDDFLKLGICYGNVVSVGSAVREIKAGDEIIYHASRLLPVPFKGEGLCLMNEGQVLGVIRKN